MSLWMWIITVVGALILLLVGYVVVINIMDNKAVARNRRFRATELEVIELTRRNDVPNLVQAFSRPLNDWEIRELIVVALGNICRDAREGMDYQRTDIVLGLNSIISQCKAQESGGTYRDNCIEHAEMLLRRFS